jgi:hypothetical protein
MKEQRGLRRLRRCVVPRNLVGRGKERQNSLCIIAVSEIRNLANMVYVNL